MPTGNPEPTSQRHSPSHVQCARVKKAHANNCRWDSQPDLILWTQWLIISALNRGNWAEQESKGLGPVPTPEDAHPGRRGLRPPQPRPSGTQAPFGSPQLHQGFSGCTSQECVHFKYKTLYDIIALGVTQGLGSFPKSGLPSAVDTGDGRSLASLVPAPPDLGALTKESSS